MLEWCILDACVEKLMENAFDDAPPKNNAVPNAMTEPKINKTEYRWKKRHNSCAPIKSVSPSLKMLLPENERFDTDEVF